MKREILSGDIVEAVNREIFHYQDQEPVSRMDRSLDNQLMLEVKAGDLDKLGVLFERYKLALHRYFYLQTGDGMASEDLVQMVFMRIMRYRDRFQPVSEFKAWMFRIAHNLGVDFVRKRARFRQYGELKDNDIIEGDTAEDGMVREEQVSLLEQAMGRLREDHREVLVLSRYQGLKYQEIGDILDCSQGAVKLRIHRALKELRKLYHELE